MAKLELINKLAMEIVNDETESYRSADINAQRIVILTQPTQINEDQQVVLDWLKCDAFSRKTLNPIGSIWKLNNCDVTENVAQAFVKLTDSKQFEVLQAFAEWGLSQND